MLGSRCWPNQSLFCPESTHGGNGEDRTRCAQAVIHFLARKLIGL
jgi:hypothetical protein